MFSPFLLQAIVLFVIIFVSNESECSFFRLKIPDDIAQISLLFTYCYPIIIGLIGLIYFSINYFELESNGVWIKTYLIVSAINFLSFIWSYALLFFVFFTPCFKWRFPL
jgi:hypothetical protein